MWTVLDESCVAYDGHLLMRAFRRWPANHGDKLEKNSLVFDQALINPQCRGGERGRPAKVSDSKLPTSGPGLEGNRFAAPSTPASRPSTDLSLSSTHSMHQRKAARLTSSRKQMRAGVALPQQYDDPAYSGGNLGGPACSSFNGYRCGSYRRDCRLQDRSIDTIACRFRKARANCLTRRRSHLWRLRSGSTQPRQSEV